MQLSDSPLKHPIPFGQNGLRDPLLETTPVGDNAASYDAGFPAITMTIKEAGGVPPQGQDMNQILYELSALARWASAGVINQFDAEFAAAVGGYPQGARVVGNDGKTVYRCTQDNNSNDPNSDQTGWDPDQLSTGDIDGLDELLDGKLNKAGDTATGPLIAPKFNMNDEQGTEDGDAVRYDYLLGSIPKRSVLLSGHLDTYTAQGFYQQSATSPDPDGALGYPVNYPGGLLAFANGGGVCQIYLTNPTSNGSQRRIYYRNYWTGNWGPWTTIYDTNFKPTPADIGAATDDHGHEIADINGLQDSLNGKASIDHTHSESSETIALYNSARTGLSFDENTFIASVGLGEGGPVRAVRISLPVFTADADGEGSEPGLICYVRVNGIDYLSNQIWIPNDQYGNGLSYSWTPMVTLQLPANTTSMSIEFRVNLVNAMQNLRHAAGYVWVDLK